MDSVAEYVYNSRPDAEVMPHVVEVWGGVMGGGGTLARTDSPSIMVQLLQFAWG